MVTLTKAEERIMQILWDLKRGFIKDIQENFPEPQPPYNTISTIVRVLVKKEIVSYKTYGGSYQYFPLISRDEYRSEQMGSLMVHTGTHPVMGEIVIVASQEQDSVLIHGEFDAPT